MTYDIYRYIFLGGAGLAGLCLIIAVILFFVLRIPSVIGDLSGSTARKAIENIRNQNENSGDKTYKSSAVNRERGKITEKIPPDGTPAKSTSDVMGGAMATTKIGTQKLAAEAQESYERSLLEGNGSNETTILDQSGSNETTILNPAGSNETTVLSQPGSGETTVLDNDRAYPEFSGTNVFAVEYELVLIHTDEVIE